MNKREWRKRLGQIKREMPAELRDANRRLAASVRAHGTTRAVTARLLNLRTELLRKEVDRHG